MNRHVDRLCRLLAMLLSLALVLGCVALPALAEDDWQQLSIVLTWTDANGVDGAAAAVPVETNGMQAFWVQVP